MKQTIRQVLRQVKKTCMPPKPSLTEIRLKQLTDSCQQYLTKNLVKPKIKILWPTPFNLDKTWWAHDGVLINALRLRGAEIIPTMCDALQSDECVIYGGLWQQSYQKNYQQTRKSLCEQCVKDDLSLWSLLDLRPIKLASYLAEQERMDLWQKAEEIAKGNWVEYKKAGFAVGYEAFKAVVNNNLQGEITPEWQENAKQIAKRHIFNIFALQMAYQRLLMIFKPDRVMGNGGFYYQWGILNHLCQQQSIPYYRYYGIGLQPMSWNYDRNNDAIFDITPAWASWLKAPWGAEKIQKVKSDLQARGLYIDVQAFPEIKSRIAETKQTFGIEGKKPTLLVFAGIIWDAATNVPSSAFENMYAWLIDTIQWFAKHPEFQCILRAHPAEDVGPTVAPDERTFFEKELEKKGIVLPSNVILIKGNAKVDSYDLMHLANACAVYTSTTGLEFACLPKPLITVGPAHYANKGFTFEPATKEAYFNQIIDLLTNPRSKDQSEHFQTLAMKYWYFYAFHASTVTGLFETDQKIGLFVRRGMNELAAHPKVLQAEDLLPGKNVQLDYLCDAILHNKPIIGDNRWPPMIESALCIT